MPQAVWTGSLSFGLVNIPVALYPATEDKAVRFHQFVEGTSDRVRNVRVNERTHEEVRFEEIVKGYDLGGGEYVVLSPEEIASAQPGRSKTIEVNAFVELADIDPVYFDRPYYLAPPSKGGGKGAERAYALLREAMYQSGKVALATFVMREKQYLVAIRPREDTLVLETLLYADEVRDPVAEIDSLPADAEFDQRELDMAKMLVDTMTADWDPEQYHDDYRDRLEEIIDQKRSGAIVSLTPPAPEAAPVVDLLAALEASLRASRGEQPEAAASASAPPAGRAPRRSKESAAPAPASITRPATRSGSRQRAASAAATSPVADDLAALDKSALSRMASELGIPGRSKMNREQLEAAVRAASEPVRKRKAS